MATDKQTTANRLNSQKCTGPRTPAGRATSSQNALKTGIDAESEVIRCEIRSEYDALIVEYYTRYPPAVPEERGLVDTLIRSEWLGRRYVCAEAAIWEYGFDNSELRNLGLVYLRSQEAFARVDRRMNSAHRNFQSALKQLRQIQADRLSQPAITPIPSEPPEASIPNRDCEGAAPQTPEPSRDGEAAAAQSPELHEIPVATKTLNPELVSFLTSVPLHPIPSTPAITTPAADPEKEINPPIAA